MARRRDGLRCGALAAALVMASTVSARSDASGNRDAGPPAATAAVTVDVSASLRPINRELIGFHGRSSATSIATDHLDVAPATHRHVMSDYDFLDYDCATDTLSPASIDYFTAWLDAVAEQGARPILSLSYVPPCYARDGQPKGPPTDEAGYRRFLDQLLSALVTDQVDRGREPLRWLELWNEPDVPLDPGSSSSGHGYVGTLDEFVERNLPSLVGAIADAEQASGVDLRVGTPAAFAPWSFGSVYGDLATLLERANGFDRATAEALAAEADTVFGPGTTDRVIDNGGVAWPARVRDEAAALGLQLDFASVHLYPNSPLLGVRFPEADEPVLLEGRNPDASPDDFDELASRWSATFPDLELVVSEWALSAGVDDRFGTCEAAAFDMASLSVMQRSAIDRALYLGAPRGVEDAPMRAWTALPATEVEVAASSSLPDGVWSTAAHDGDRTTVLLSHWHPELTDARDLAVPVVVEGLPDGTYEVIVERIGHGTSPAMATSTSTATSADGRLEVGAPVGLRGQSLARIDVRTPTAPELPPLTTADPSGAAHECLAPTPDANDERPAIALPAGPLPAAPRYTG